MALCVVICLCLLGKIHYASGVPNALINDTQLPDTDTTPYTRTLNNFTHTSTENPTHEWETTQNISKNNKEIASLKTQLDDLFDRTMRAGQSYFGTGNRTMLEFTTNLTENYEEISNNFSQIAKLQNICQNRTKSQKDKCDETWEYDVKLEMVQVLSSELQKISNETQIINDSKQNDSKEISTTFEELLSIFKLKKELEKLYSDKRQLKIQTVEDMDVVIKLLKDIINTEEEILHIIKNSKNVRTPFEEEYSSKLNIVNYLINASRWNEKLEQHEEESRNWQNHKAQHQTYDIVRLVVMPAGFGVIFILGIIGNGVLLIVFLNHGDMRTAPNVMIINLTIADTLGVIVNLLVNILTHTITFTWADPVCQMYHFITRMVIEVSIYSVAAISIQRFVVLTDFFKCDGSMCRFFGKYQTFLNVFLVWAFATVVPIAYGVNARADPECKQTESTDKEFNRILTFVNFTVTLVLPFVIIAITSGLTSWHLKYTVKNMPGEGIGQEKAKQARVVSANIFVALIIVFAVCYIPMFSLMVYINVSPVYTYTTYYVHVALFWLMYCITCFNPIVLYIGSSKYRKYMNMYLCCRFRKDKNTPK